VTFQSNPHASTCGATRATYFINASSSGVHSLPRR
jgi:hypothetical protein